jgi:integrase
VARENLTAGRVAAFNCPKGKGQAFLWDRRAPGLALRVTEGTGRAYIFQSRLDGKALRVTIGEPDSWSIPDAQAEARRLQGLIDQGKDPRLDKAATIEREAAARQAVKVERDKLATHGLDTWAAYLADRKGAWGPRNYADHAGMSAAGGEKRKRTKGRKVAGPLYALLNRPLAEIDAAAVSAWVTRETKVRPARAALGFRQLRAFINWGAASLEYRDIVQAGACAPKNTREKLAKPAARSDVLQREQLAPWFAEVRKLPPVVSTYLQGLLLTGARREELAGLRWADVDFKWQSLRLADKVEGERLVSLPPYLARLLADLKRINDTPPPAERILHGKRIANDIEHWQPSPWVFSSPSAASGRLQEPRIAHNRALLAAGLPSMTLHGLRRSFGTLSEWCEVPVGIVGQIMGHKPSAIAEKHYRVRPLDLLRMWHERIEAWILTEAGIGARSAEESGKVTMTVVQGGRK